MLKIGFHFRATGVSFERVHVSKDNIVFYSVNVF
jgi:hypothetical protein